MLWSPIRTSEDCAGNPAVRTVRRAEERRSDEQGTVQTFELSK